MDWSRESLLGYMNKFGVDAPYSREDLVGLFSKSLITSDEVILLSDYMMGVTTAELGLQEHITPNGIRKRITNIIPKLKK